ncbi:UNVERIFIED_CONTAM: hypothetical protein HDU68_009500 [Siphonaria sp. JEL0065]|nr:hypothetical protein HDU68_009500 [Siphonaria sp. JEL0065]
MVRVLVPSFSRLEFVGRVLFELFELDASLDLRKCPIKFVVVRNVRTLGVDGVEDGQLAVAVRGDSPVASSVNTETITFKTINQINRIILSSYAPGCYIRHSHPHEQLESDKTFSNFNYSLFEHVRDIRAFSLDLILSPSFPFDQLSLVIHDFAAGLRHVVDIKLIQAIPINSSHIEKIPHCTGGTSAKSNVSLTSTEITSINKKLKILAIKELQNRVSDDIQLEALKLHVHRWFEGKDLTVVESGNLMLWNAKVNSLVDIRDKFLKRGSVGDSQGTGCGWREPDGNSCTRCRSQFVQMEEIDSDDEEGDLFCFRQHVLE